MPIDKNREDFRFYRIWADMKTRCTNSKCKSYIRYGGRGIKIEDNWICYNNFYSDMWNIYQEHVRKFGEKQTTLDRINTDGNYSKTNCRFATYGEQNINKRNNAKFIAIKPDNTRILCNSQKELEKYGIARQRIYDCLHGKAKSTKGWKFEQIN